MQKTFGETHIQDFSFQPPFHVSITSPNQWERNVVKRFRFFEKKLFGWFSHLTRWTSYSASPRATSQMEMGCSAFTRAAGKRSFPLHPPSPEDSHLCMCRARKWPQDSHTLSPTALTERPSHTARGEGGQGCPCALCIYLDLVHNFGDEMHRGP